MTKKPTRDIILKSGKVLTEADFERMAEETETAEFDLDRLEAKVIRRGGRPPIGDGPSAVLQVRLDEATRTQLAERAAREQATPSSIARDAIRAWLNAS
jgi:hypothetical protein